MSEYEAQRKRQKPSIENHSAPLPKRVGERDKPFVGNGPEPKSIGRAARKESLLDPGWTPLTDEGIVYKEEGVNFRSIPDSASTRNIVKRLAHNTRLLVIKQNAAEKWFAVTLDSGELGYVNSDFVWRKLPDPAARVKKIKHGETPIGIAAKEYPEFDTWGADQRFVVNALVYANTNTKHNGRGEPGLRKSMDIVNLPWFMTAASADVYLWLPSASFLGGLHGLVTSQGGGSGSVTADVWTKQLANQMHAAPLSVTAFVGGLGHGVYGSLKDTVVGAAELLVNIITNHKQQLVELGMSLDRLRRDPMQIATYLESWWATWGPQLTSDDPWVRAHAWGYLIGYVLAELAMLVLGPAEVKAIARSATSLGTRLGKMVEASDAALGLARELELLKTSDVGKELEAAAVIRRRKYQSTARFDGSLPAGEGATDKYGNIRVSPHGTTKDKALALAHEKVHSQLSPKTLNKLREFRADVRILGYEYSSLLKYIEEALAETVAQVRVNGPSLRSVIEGLKFPVTHGYVVLSAVLAETAVGTIMYGGVLYGVYVISDDKPK